MAKNVYDLLGQFVLQEQDFDNSKIGAHHTITLLGINPSTSEGTLIEYYPTTSIKNVFLTKDDTEPIDLLNPEIHLDEESAKLLRSSPLVGGIVCLDENGWIPFEYFDKTCFAMYFEFDTYADMIANNVFEPEHYGRMVLVWDIRDHETTYTDEKPVWGVYRLIGDPHQESGWQKIFMEQYDTRVITWDMIPKDLQSTVQEINEMVRLSHSHPDKSALDSFTIDNEGRLCYKDKAIMMRKDFQTLFMPINEEQTRKLRGGDTAAIIYSERAIVKPIPATYVDTSELESIEGFYKDRADISEILYMETGRFTSFNEFAHNCYNLIKIPSLNYNNVVSMRESFMNCTRLNWFYGITAPNLRYLINTFSNCKSLKVIGKIEGAYNIEHVSGAFLGCESLEDLPVMDFSGTKYFDSFCSGCINLREFSNTIIPVNFHKAFFGCKSLTSVKLINFSRCRDLSGCFDGCTNLTDVKIVPGTLKKSISFKGTSLQISSLMEIINGLPEISTEKTIDVTNTPASGISSNYIQIARDKGWTILI